ncbi:hypothetical protein NL676_023800 [Syzygium grande]|nr:hypothetical protein NL676_023800 [Syzygium grande]
MLVSFVRKVRSVSSPGFSALPIGLQSAGAQLLRRQKGIQTRNPKKREHLGSKGRACVAEAAVPVARRRASPLGRPRLIATHF